MADFKTHLIGAASISGIAATGLMVAGIAQPLQVLTCFSLGTLGGLLPDIDSKNSVPFRLAFNLLAIFIGFVVVAYFGLRYSLVELALLWIGCFILIRHILCPLFIHLTVHRGLVHSIPAGMLCGLITVLLLYYCFNITAEEAWLGGSFVLLGFIVHLLLDELYSVDLFGRQLKRSFGTALKLGSLKNLVGTFNLYLAVIGLGVLAPSPQPFFDKVTDKTHYAQLQARLWPQQRWFADLWPAP